MTNSSVTFNEQFFDPNEISLRPNCKSMKIPLTMNMIIMMKQNVETSCYFQLQHHSPCQISNSRPNFLTFHSKHCQTFELKLTFILSSNLNLIFKHFYLVARVWLLAVVQFLALAFRSWFLRQSLYLPALGGASNDRLELKNGRSEGLGVLLTDIVSTSGPLSDKSSSSSNSSSISISPPKQHFTIPNYHFANSKFS